MAAPSRPAQRSSPDPRQAYREQFGRQARHVPTDKFFADINEALARKASAQEIRVLALREVQRACVDIEDKVKMFIPAARIANVYGIEDILHAINREPQSSTWDNALTSLCDFVCVRGHGIRFTCTNRDLAIKIGGTAVSCMGEKLIVKPYSAYERFYYVGLTRIPSDLDEDVIYDYLFDLGLQPIIAPTHRAGSLTSRDRTVWFPQHDVPDALMKDNVPLREILFPGFDNPVFVQHKKRSLNKVVPPSILAKREAATEQARLAEEAKAARRTQRLHRRGQSASAAPATPPAQPLTPQEPDGVGILERPTPSAPVQDWVKVTRHALCSSAPASPATAEVEISTTQGPNGRVVFGFPVKPTAYEMAFSDHDFDEPTSGDADCVAFVDQKAKNTIKRSEYRRRARKAANELPSLGEPEDRLAALTAQPSAYAAIVHASPQVLADVVEEHALVRLYSGKPSTTHGTERSLFRRVVKDYPGDIPSSASAVLADQIPDDTTRDAARAYARMDLFFRTHAPAIYHDPVKVQALCGDVLVSSFQYSHFLLWTDQTLAALCASQLGQKYEQYLSEPLRQAFHTILEDAAMPTQDNMSIDAEAPAPPADDESSGDESMGSPESPEATHL